MGNWLRLTAGFLAGIVITALLQPIIERWLDHAGWYDAPYDAAGSAMNWVQQIVGVDAFPWVAAGALGLAAGLWLDPILRRLDGRHPVTKSGKAKKFAASARWHGAALKSALHKPLVYKSEYERMMLEAAVLANKISLLGVPFPYIEPKATVEEKMHAIGMFLEFSAPFLEEGDMGGLQLIADELHRNRISDAQGSQS